MYELDKPDNLVEMFEQSVARFADNEWLGTKNEAKDGYDWVTYRQAADRVDNLRAGLAHLGVEKGSTVAIIANNRVEWAIACYATYGRCARFVPMYEAELEKIWKYIVSDSGTRVLLVSKPGIFETVKGWVNEIDSLEHVILIEGKGPGTMEELERIGSKNPVKSVYPDAGDIAGLIYTSGTTGDPKGVLLSHGNFTSNVHAAGKTLHQLDETCRTLSFLPWAHSFGQTAELHFLMSRGASTGFAESPKTIVDDLPLLKPGFLVAVPRIFNRVYDGLRAKMDDEGGVAKFLFDMGVEAGQKRREMAKEGKSCFWTNLKFAVADKIVFQKIRDKFGGRLECCLSSSAALSPHIAEFFFDIGIPVYEAWGMTELSPAAAINSPDEFRIGSVGKAIDKVRFVIDRSVPLDDPREGELIVYGPNVMQGYHNKPEKTRETMTEDGGLRTGDQAYIDDDGFLYITGRIKEQFKLENGKFVYPAAMEEEIKLLPWVEYAMIHGLNQPFTVCLVYPDFEVMKKYAPEKGFPSDPEEMAQDPKFRQFIEDEIVRHLKGKFGSYEIPKQYIILSEGFTVENGMLTQTLKLKRREVMKSYGDAIDSAYRNN